MNRKFDLVEVRYSSKVGVGIGKSELTPCLIVAYTCICFVDIPGGVKHGATYLKVQRKKFESNDGIPDAHCIPVSPNIDEVPVIG